MKELGIWNNQSHERTVFLFPVFVSETAPQAPKAGGTGSTAGGDFCTYMHFVVHTHPYSEYVGTRLVFMSPTEGVPSPRFRLAAVSTRWLILHPSLHVGHDSYLDFALKNLSGCSGAN